jgi:hypothetical protein
MHGSVVTEPLPRNALSKSVTIYSHCHTITQALVQYCTTHDWTLGDRYVVMYIIRYYEYPREGTFLFNFTNSLSIEAADCL